MGARTLGRNLREPARPTSRAGQALRSAGPESGRADGVAGADRPRDGGVKPRCGAGRNISRIFPRGAPAGPAVQERKPPSPRLVGTRWGRCPTARVTPSRSRGPILLAVRQLQASVRNGRRRAQRPVTPGRVSLLESAVHRPGPPQSRRRHTPAVLNLDRAARAGPGRCPLAGRRRAPRPS